MLGDEKKLQKYMAFGDYHWRWYGRKRSYTSNADHLKEWVEEKNTLDIGAGDGFITFHLGLIKGIDNDPYGVEIAKSRNSPVELGDAYSLPYADEEFDSALMTDTIEHFSRPEVVLAEAHRVIKLFLYVNIEQVANTREPDHYFSWTPEEFVTFVESNGFKLEQPIQSLYRRHYFKFRKVPK